MTQVLSFGHEVLSTKLVRRHYCILCSIEVLGKQV